jgi:hypothetical protein
MYNAADGPLPIEPKRPQNNGMAQNATLHPPDGEKHITDADGMKLLLDADESIEGVEKKPDEKAWEQVAAKNAPDAAKNAPDAAEVAKVDADIEEKERHLPKKRTGKPKRKDPSPPTMAGPRHPAAHPLSTGSIQSTEPIPQWARAYQRGMLGHLGLQRGEWGNDITVNVQGKMSRPGNSNSSTETDETERKAFNWNWGLYTLLARIPGGRASLDVLYRVCLEWCDLLVDTKGSNGSCRHSLSTQPCFISEDYLWRLANISEKTVKKPGPAKGEKPFEKWKKTKEAEATKAPAAEGPTGQQSERPTSTDPGRNQPPTTHSSPPQLSLSNNQQIELPSPTGSASSQSSTPISLSLSTQSCIINIQSPNTRSPPPRVRSTDSAPIRRKRLQSEKPKTLKEDANKQGNTRVPDMANSPTVLGSTSTLINHRSSTPTRAQRTLLPTRRPDILGEDANKQESQGPGVVNNSTPPGAPFTLLNAPSSALSLRIHLPSKKPETCKEDANKQGNTRDLDMANSSALPVVGFTAINHQSSGFTPINRPSCAPSAKRKLENEDDDSEPAAKSQRVE